MSYTHKYKPIVFNGLPTNNRGYTEEKVFNTKKEFENWFKELSIGLAELDECMNYCKYFILFS